MKKNLLNRSFLFFLAFCLLITGASSAISAQAQDAQIEVISPYLSIEHRFLSDGSEVSGAIINGPSEPPFPVEEYIPTAGASVQRTFTGFPSYSWLYGCSAVSGAMIAAYYDNHAFPNLYSGPSNNGVMPLTDTSWPAWSDSVGARYPSNPLVASRNGLDGRTGRGSIEDYWLSNNSTAADPYITGNWAQHAWGAAIGDYMWTSQSAMGNPDGGTRFFTYTVGADKLSCSYMASKDLKDGTLGRSNFYRAKGYTVTDCYNQPVDTAVAGGFSLADMRKEIDNDNPVMLNLAGHTVVVYGYDGDNLLIRDTWSSDPSSVRSVPWGGSYQGMAIQSVSIVHIAYPFSMDHKLYLPLINKPVPPVTQFVNPGFELGRSVGWKESTSSETYVITYNGEYGSVQAYAGNWFAWLGGLNNENANLWQSLTISSANPILTFFIGQASAETVCTNDILTIYLNDRVLNSVGLCQSTNTGAWVMRSYNLSAYIGKTVTIKFTVKTNGNDLNSHVFIDNVMMASLKEAEELSTLSLPALENAFLLKELR